MTKLSAAVIAAFAGIASARQCQNLTIPVELSARNGNFPGQEVTETDIEVTNFILNLSQQGNNYTEQVLDGYNTISGSYEIAATYCQPDNGPANVLQVLTHGIGFDRSYWDVPFNYPNYSYVADAVDKQGYSTFAWDRLGIGMSSHGDPIKEIQAYLEVDALRALTEKLREGSISGIDNKFNTVVHVGHSFGSEHSYLLTAKYPDLSDGIVLTGFSRNGSFLPFFELGGNFVDAPSAGIDAYSHGYLAAGDESGVQTNFFSPGSFPPEFLTFATTNGQPVTLGELLTIGGEIAVPNTFCGPVLVITGERDVPYCGGDCLAAAGTGYDNIPAKVQEGFPNTEITVDIVAGAGHGLNFEYSHPETYSSIFSFLSDNGLAADSEGISKNCQPGSADQNQDGQGNKGQGWGQGWGGWPGHHGGKGGPWSSKGFQA
ncbi:hypothetical protein KC332_g9633 [Hortaea werneckii]|uniref:AB hydrolase-1 domain-containing protein n=2 Tax=Hortaea werneckii TaxID=91943 RepID=A0A3M7HQB1_HORWE|nr:hypothetical protein KC358_g15642 [Hortaea werneckii]OTA37008.1 hypothetical protein BTJ68_02319 [Hortaea werneckii EXF-2000]KAI6810331.1 hypothetical protein KC350_g12577 [Hortaea werneckii]KAI6926821.1 hypothetical protein KC341_g12550 [Hortaea werneckii]KAI6942551.1 hypothetical protein KC348_g4416 [Hortaea werneckii]